MAPRFFMSKQNIYLVGLMAVGKSTVGRTLAGRLDYDFYDSDHVIEERAGADISWIFDVEGEAGFRERETAVLDELTRLEGIVLATGGGAVLRAENRRMLAARRRCTRPRPWRAKEWRKRTEGEASAPCR